MADLNFTSLLDTIVPPAFIEEVSIRYPSDSEINVFDQPGVPFVDQYGNTQYTTAPITQGQQQFLDTIAVDVKVFLMLDEKTYRKYSQKEGMQVYVLLADNRKKINLLRGGDFKFQEIQSLISGRELNYQIIPFRKILDNVQVLTSNGMNYYKLTTEATIQTIETNNLAAFCFVTVPTTDIQNSRTSLSSENLLYGKITGEIALTAGTTPASKYYFLNAAGQIWAGGVHRHTPDNSQSSDYMEGLKHSAEPHGILIPTLTNVYKVFDRRATDIDTVFDTLNANFNFIEETKVFEDTQTAEKLSFIPKVTGLSKVISTIVKEKGFRNTKIANNVSNLVFMDVEKVLRENSVYSSMIDRLDANELVYVQQSSYVDSFEVDRVSDLDNGEIRETIISTAFKPGSPKTRVSTKNIAGSQLTSEDKYTTYVYYEDAEEGTFGQPLNKFRMFSFVDEVAPVYRKSDFHYEVRINMEDGLTKFINDKIEQVGAQLADFKKLYSKLSNPNAYDENGDFKDSAKNIEEFELPDLLGTMVSALAFFFDLSGVVTPENLYRSLYFATNPETGNFYELQKVYDNYEKLYSLLTNSFGVNTNSMGAVQIDATPSGKEPKQITVSRESAVINLNFEDTVGISFHDYNNPLYAPGAAGIRTPIFMPIVSRAALESTTRIDDSLSNPLQNETFLTYYKPYTVFLDRDYRVQKKDLNEIENNAEYLDYLSILLTDSIRQTLQDKYSGKLDFSTTKAGNKKENLLNTKDLKFYRYVSILDSLSTNGISIDFDFDSASSFLSTFGNRSEVENQEDVSKLMNLDEISTRLPLVFSKAIQGSVVNDDALANFKDDSLSNPFVQSYSENLQIDLPLELPFQYTAISARENSSDTILNPDGSALNLFDTNHLAYYYYNYSLIGRVKVLTNFDDSMNPIYENLTTAILEGQNLGPGTKYLCKVETYNNDEFLTNLYDKVKTRIIETNFVALQDADAATNQVPLEDVVQQGTVTAPTMPQLSISLQGTREQIAQYNSVGFNIFEKYFSTSVYVEQPEEVKELRFEFDRPDLEAPPSATTAGSTTGQSAGTTPTTVNQGGTTLFGSTATSNAGTTFTGGY